MKKIVGFLLVVLICNAVIAQEDSKKGKPDIPGTLLIDLGFNVLNNAPEVMDTKLLGSKTFNLYYQYDINFGDSKFSFHPGIGVGIDKYHFDKDVGVFNNSEQLITTNNSGEVDTTYTFNLSVDPLSDHFPSASGFDKSKLAATYLDFPVEFRFHTNPYDKSRSFKFGIGGRIGLRLNSQTKIKYTEDENTVKLKNNQNYDMNNIRYGATARIGIGWFNLFYYHNFSDIFKTSKGPTPDTAITSYTIGLTIAGF